MDYLRVFDKATGFTYNYKICNIAKMDFSKFEDYNSFDKKFIDVLIIRFTDNDSTKFRVNDIELSFVNN